MTTILITGANRGIGLEHVRQALAKGDHVIAGCRNPDAANALSALSSADDKRLTIAALDVASPESIADFAERLGDRPVDILINNAGISGSGAWDPNDTAQSTGSINYDAWSEVMATNLFGPARMVEALLGNLREAPGGLVVMMSSDLASIARNSLGGSHLYRTSKAALNMLAHGMAVDLAAEGISVVALSPGWTRTDMGGENAFHSVEHSVTAQRKVIAGLSASDSGKFYDLNGDEVPW